MRHTYQRTVAHPFLAGLTLNPPSATSYEAGGPVLAGLGSRVTRYRWKSRPDARGPLRATNPTSRTEGPQGEVAHYGNHSRCHRCDAAWLDAPWRNAFYRFSASIGDRRPSR